MDQQNTRLEWRADQGGLVTVRVLEDVKKSELYELEQAHSEDARVLSEIRTRRAEKVAELEAVETELKAAERAFEDSKSRLERGQALVEEHAGDVVGATLPDSARPEETPDGTFIGQF